MIKRIHSYKLFEYCLGSIIDNNSPATQGYTNPAYDQFTIKFTIDCSSNNLQHIKYKNNNMYKLLL